MKDKIFMILLGIIAINLTYLSLNLKDIDFSQSQDKPAFINPFEPDEDGDVSFTPEELNGMNRQPATYGALGTQTTRVLDAIRDIEASLRFHHAQITCLLYTSPSPRD